MIKDFEEDCYILSVAIKERLAQMSEQERVKYLLAKRVEFKEYESFK